MNIKHARILCIINKAPNTVLSVDNLISEIERYTHIDCEELDSILGDLSLSGLINHRGDLYFTTSLGGIIAGKISNQ